MAVDFALGSRQLSPSQTVYTTDSPDASAIWRVSDRPHGQSFAAPIAERRTGCPCAGRIFSSALCWPKTHVRSSFVIELCISEATREKLTAWLLVSVRTP